MKTYEIVTISMNYSDILPLLLLVRNKSANIVEYGNIIIINTNNTNKKLPTLEVRLFSNNLSVMRKPNIPKFNTTNYPSTNL